MLAPALIKLTDATGQYSFVGVTDANSASALGTTDFYQTPSGLLLPGSAIANAPLTATTTMQNNAGALQVGTSLNTSGYGIAVLAITASTSPAWSGTITFEGQGPDGNWYPVAARSRGTGAVAMTATAGGLYSINCRGLSAVRAHITAYTAGTVTVVGQAQALGAAAGDEVLQTQVGNTINASLTGSNATIGNVGLNAGTNEIGGVFVKSSGGSEVFIGTNTADNVGGVGVAPGMSAYSYPMLYNEGGYDRLRNNTQATLLAGAARTTSVYSPTVTNYNARGIVLFLNITALTAGASPSLSVNILGSAPSGSYFIADTTFTPVTGAHVIAMYPGATAAVTGTYDSFVRGIYSIPIPKQFLVYVNLTNITSITYQLDYSLIV